MYLEYHPGPVASVLQRGRHPVHGHLDDVGGTALDGGVYGVALGKSADGGVARADVLDVPPSAEDGGHIAFLPSLGLGPLHVVRDGRIVPEVFLDELRGLLARNV